MSFSRHLRLLCAGLWALWSLSAWATEPGPTDHRVGHKTCSGSLCHAATQPWMRDKDAQITQREFLVWQREDAHATAYDALVSEAGKRIAANLGISNAHRDPMCLTCHADYVPPAQRAPDVVMSAGVTCEACHGGAKNWLITHMTDDRQTNLANGMYPTDDPVARAKLCTSCHVGTKDRAISHRLMGAGHPRLSFELDTFSSIMPPHWVEDADYVQRKGRTSSSQMWMAGQLVTLERKMKQLEDHPFDGIFPELSFFDCHGCHHPMDDKRWAPAMGGQAGVPRLEDSAGSMVQHIAGVVDEEQAKALSEARACLTRAAETSWSDAAACARQIRETTAAIRARGMGRRLSDETLWGLMSDILGDTPVDYADAEQSCMASHTLYSELRARGAVSDEVNDAGTTAFEMVYRALEDEGSYRFAQATEALGRLKAVLIPPREASTTTPGAGGAGP